MKTIEQAKHTLEQYGFQDCTHAASQQDGTTYLCAFDGSGEEQGMRYCCLTEDDLFALVSLVEASAGK
jgi:hypothetical protein